jgi:hypothetical protein
MKIQKFGIILLSFFLIIFLFDYTVSGEEVPREWKNGIERIWDIKSTDEGIQPDGTEGFETSVIKEKENGETSTGESISLDGENNTPETEEIESEDEAASSEDEGEVLEGVIDVDTYLNVRTGPWGKIVGGLYSGDKIKILAKEGDWFKIKQGEEICYVHAYYVDAPGYPSHQGIEPPSGVGSDESPTGDPGSSPTVDNGTFGAEPVTPMPSSVSSNFGPRDLSVGSKFHEGIDLPVSNGTQCNALGNGVVGDVGWTDGGGKYVWVHYDNGYSSWYCHLEGVNVSPGQRVAIGQGIATSDNTGEWTTGAHLHMGVTDSSGSFVNPRDIPGLEFPPLVE